MRDGFAFGGGTYHFDRSSRSAEANRLQWLDDLMPWNCAAYTASACRLPSSRSAIASIIWKVLVPELGADIEAHFGLQQALQISGRQSPTPDGLLAAYGELAKAW